MMDIQTTPLIPDLEYYLDSALEHGEIDAGSHVTLKLYAPRVDLMRIIDDEWKLGPQQLNPRLARNAALVTLADDLLSRMPLAQRGPIAAAGLRAMRALIDTNAWWMATFAHQDMISGGCMEPFKRPKGGPEQRRLAAYRLTPKQARRLNSRAWVKHYINRLPETRDMRLTGRRVLDRLQGVDMAAVAAEAEKIATALQAQHEGYRRHNQRVIAQMTTAAQLGRMIAGDDRRVRRRRRSVIKRAVVLASSVLGSANLSAFAAGRGVELQGQTISLEVARLGSSASMGHGQLAVTAIDPVSKRRLADLCIYHEQTPAIDQATALALAMQAGEEAEILATANLSRVTDLGIANPLIAERGKQNMERQWRPRDAVAAENEAYWIRTKSMWVDTLGVIVLGRWHRRTA